jgi:hypothetical protein
MQAFLSIYRNSTRSPQGYEISDRKDIYPGVPWIEKDVSKSAAPVRGHVFSNSEDTWVTDVGRPSVALSPRSTRTSSAMGQYSRAVLHSSTPGRCWSSGVVPWTSTVEERAASPSLFQASSAAAALTRSAVVSD